MKKRLCLIFFIIFGVIYVWAEDFGMVFARTGNASVILYYKKGIIDSEDDYAGYGDEKTYWMNIVNGWSLMQNDILERTKYDSVDVTLIWPDRNGYYQISNTQAFRYNYRGEVAEVLVLRVRFFENDSVKRLYESGIISLINSTDVYHKQRKKYLEMLGVK